LKAVIMVFRDDYTDIFNKGKYHKFNYIKEGSKSNSDQMAIKPRWQMC
ncbi:hypothetical protein pb186bvf_015533, partial [Paramecium bursaria]